MTLEKTIVVDSALAGQTLAAVVRRSFGSLTWNQTRQLIAARRVRVDASVCLDDARRLKVAEKIDVLAASSARPAAEMAVRIVHRDADLVVVEKPPGIQTVRRIEERNWSDERKQRQPVLLELVQRMVDAERAGAGGRRRGADKKLSRPRPKAPPMAPTRVRPVHRLDRDTSGLMMFAISPAAEAELVRRFAGHSIQRVYLAVAIGILREAKKIESWIVRDRGDGIRGSVPGGKSSPTGQRAVTHVRPVKHLGKEFTIVECKLETGRTHQIRIHMAEMGHPLCGEKIYLRAKTDEQITVLHGGAPRQALHSAELEFEHPTTGKTMRFESPWPPDLARWLGHHASSETGSHRR
ncbi:MAG TPA: RluA family pseudouridine synthase, partial [Tepidisphaeraceae bacterium]|nr:RluA family pseudouridine synthase [Tepidisphaeraceae bacterium]